MHRYTLGGAFTEAIAFIQNNLANVLILLGGAIAIGQVVQALLIGGPLNNMSEQLAEQIRSGNVSAATFAGGLGLAMLVAALLQSVAQFAVLRQGLSDEKDVGTTIAYGVVATILNILFGIAVAIVLILIIVAMAAVLGVGAAFGGGSEPSGAGIMAIAGTVLLALLVIVPLSLWLGARLWVAAPAMAAARSINPLYGIAASWRMTSGSVQWSVLGTFLLYILVVLAMSMVLGLVGGILGLIGGEMVGGMLGGIIAGVPVGIFSVAMPAGVFTALSPVDSRYDIFN